MSYITIDKIDKYFGKNHVLQGIELKVEKGDMVTLLGPSGCGKSTLLRCIAGLEQISNGKVFIDGEEITQKEAKDRNVGMIFQQYSLFPNLSVFENISFGLKLKKVNKYEIIDKVEKAINIVDLKGKENQYPAQLSGGQQQRVALARAIVTSPKVLLFDEPLSAVDAKLRRSLQSRIKEIHRELILTSIFVTHDQDEAMIMSDQIHLFNNGKIEQSGNPLEMYTAPKSNFAAGFIGHYNIISQKDFLTLTGEKRLVGADIAIRPETIGISKIPFELHDDSYQFKGTINNHTIRGNVIRYGIESKGIKLNTDVLFRSFMLFDEGSEIFISIEKHNCLNLTAN
jgi:putative spermidine/putrescine transport system ATP-binding protein